MVKYDIFKIEDGLLILDKDYIRGIPKFRILLERDKGSDNDHDGRKKYRSFKELYYIKMVADKFCYPSQAGLNEKETHVCAIKESDLESDFKPDKTIKEAIEKYRELQDLTTPTLNTICSLLQGLKVSNVICNNIIKNIESTLELMEGDKQKCLEAGLPIDLAKDLAMTAALIQQLEQLNKISNNIPKTIETLEKLQEKLSKEISGTNIARGGNEIGTRAIPKS